MYVRVRRNNPSVGSFCYKSHCGYRTCSGAFRTVTLGEGGKLQCSEMLFTSKGLSWFCEVVNLNQSLSRKREINVSLYFLPSSYCKTLTSSHKSQDQDVFSDALWRTEPVWLFLSEISKSETAKHQPPQPSAISTSPQSWCFLSQAPTVNGYYTWELGSDTQK